MTTLLTILTPALVATLSQAPNTTLQTKNMGDSVLVVHTVCEPICSSRVCVYNKVGEPIRTVQPPFEGAIFPYAVLEGDSLRWEDNTHLLYDDEELQRMQLQAQEK